MKGDVPELTQHELRGSRCTMRPFKTALFLFVATAVLIGCSAPHRGEAGPTAGATYDPAMVYKMRGEGFIFTEQRVATMPDGSPRIFRVANIGKPGTPRLDDYVAGEIARLARGIREPYRSRLSFVFEETYGLRYLVMFIDGYPQYPIVSLCHADFNCSHNCPDYFDPVLRIVRVSTMSACADKMPIWTKRV